MQVAAVCIDVQTDQCPVSSVSHGAGCSEIRQELETQANDKVPDVSCHLRSCNKDAPDQNHQDGVESIANVP